MTRLLYAKESGAKWNAYKYDRTEKNGQVFLLNFCSLVEMSADYNYVPYCSSVSTVN
jgi:hypothetical protein